MNWYIKIAYIIRVWMKDRSVKKDYENSVEEGDLWRWKRWVWMEDMSLDEGYECERRLRE